MNSDLIWIIVWSVAAIALFIWLWRAGHLARLSGYIQLTKEELRKCTWPTWEELKGSTLLVTMAIVFLGVFTFAVDRIFFGLFMFFKI